MDAGNMEDVEEIVLLIPLARHAIAIKCIELFHHGHRMRVRRNDIRKYGKLACLFPRLQTG